MFLMTEKSKYVKNYGAARFFFQICKHGWAKAFAIPELLYLPDERVGTKSVDFVGCLQIANDFYTILAFVKKAENGYV